MEDRSCWNTGTTEHLFLSGLSEVDVQNRTKQGLVGWFLAWFGGSGGSGESVASFGAIKVVIWAAGMEKC